MRITLPRLKKRYKLRQNRKVHAIKRAARRPIVAVPFVTVSVLLFLSTVAIILLSGGKPALRSTDTHVVIINHDNIERSLPTREKQWVIS